MKKINPIIKRYSEEKLWVNYQLLKVGGRKTKIPYSPITRMKASSTDSSTWGTYKEAETFDSKHIGIVFSPEKLLLGVDMDHILEGNNITGDKKEIIAEFMIEVDTYQEVSPSSTGLHFLFELTAPLTLLANRHQEFEAYTAGRYFTFTNNPYKETKPLRKITPEKAIELLTIIGYPWGKGDLLSAPADNKEAEEVISTSKLSNDNLLSKMFRSKNGSSIKAIYNGKATDSVYKGDDSVADMALLSHLAFWTRKDPQLMEQLWINSPQGQRAKTQTRKDYRSRSIATAISHCSAVLEEKDSTIKKEIEENAPALDLLYTTVRGERIYTQNTENMCRILRHHNLFVGKLRYDEFKNTLEIKKKEYKRAEEHWMDLEDHDVVNIQTTISVLFPCFGKVGKEMVYDAILKIMRENTIDSAKDYVFSLVWDKTPRLDSWLSSTYNTPDDVYHRAVGSNWMKGLIKRICEPGCKFDYVLVLEGEQGTRKSTSLSIIGNVYADQPSWHVETTMSTDNKDFFMQFQGKAIIEFSEGETLSRTEVKKMKAIITTSSDKYRPAYGRLSVDFPRRCVFAMTTNQQEYLKDETGNRRWLPVACIGDANIDWLTENRDQLFAEAYHRVITLRETTWEFPEEETREMQSARRVQSPSRDLIADWYLNKLTEEHREMGITTYQVYRDALHGGMPTKTLSRFDEMEITDVLKTYLKLEKVRKMVNGINANRWFMDEKSMQSAEPLPASELEEFTGHLGKF